jgi:hypothetical protein
VKLVPSLPSAVTAVTVAADRTAPQVPGTTVTFTASATGGVAPVQFKWLVYDGVSSTVASDWSAAATFAWTPMAANASYTVTVWARSAGNGEDGPEKSAETAFPIEAKPTSAVTLTASKPAPQLVGTAVTFTATAIDGVEPVEFKWLVYDGVSSTVASNWNPTATFTWTPATANLSYKVIVWARSAGNGADAPEVTAEMPFAILPNPLSGIVSLTVDQTAPQKPGTTITFKANWVGAPAPVEFKWLVSDGSSSKVMQDWSAAPTFAWTPTAADKYTVSVWARRAGNGNDAAEKSAAMTFTIKGKAPEVRK